MTTYGYVRVSIGEQSHGSSPESQRHVITHIAAALNQQLSAIFEDIGISGSLLFSKRPAGAQLVAQLVPGDVVIVSQLDRAFRNTLDCIRTVENWKTQGVNLILVDLGLDSVTNGNAVAQLLLTVMAAFAQWKDPESADSG